MSTAHACTVEVVEVLCNEQWTVAIAARPSPTRPLAPMLGWTSFFTRLSGFIRQLLIIGSLRGGTWEPRFVVFADFHGLHAPTMVSFKGPAVQQLVGPVPEQVAIGSQEPALTSSSTPPQNISLIQPSSVFHSPLSVHTVRKYLLKAVIIFCCCCDT